MISTGSNRLLEQESWLGSPNSSVPEHYRWNHGLNVLTKLQLDDRIAVQQVSPWHGWPRNDRNLPFALLLDLPTQPTTKQLHSVDRERQIQLSLLSNSESLQAVVVVHVPDPGMSGRCDGSSDLETSQELLCGLARRLRPTQQQICEVAVRKRHVPAQEYLH